MPSKNRIAGYPPDHILEAFHDFKDKEGITESKALIKVLAGYFGVAENVAQEVSTPFVRVEQLQKIEQELSELRGLYSDLLSGLKADTQNLKPKIEEVASDFLENHFKKDDSKNESESSLIKTKEHSGQLEILEDCLLTAKDGVGSSSADSRILPLNSAELSNRFGKGGQFVKSLKNYYKERPEVFRQKIQEADPDDIAWEYHEDDRLYHPVQEVSPSQERGAKQSGVANS